MAARLAFFVTMRMLTFWLESFTAVAYISSSTVFPFSVNRYSIHDFSGEVNRHNLKNGYITLSENYLNFCQFEEPMIFL